MKYQSAGLEINGRKCTNATDLRLFALKLFDQGATLFLKFFKLILVWRKYLLSFLAVNLCLNGF